MFQWYLGVILHIYNVEYIIESYKLRRHILKNWIFLLLAYHLLSLGKHFYPAFWKNGLNSLMIFSESETLYVILKRMA